MKLKDLFIILILVANSCSLEYKKESNLTDTAIAKIFEDYYEFKSRINPIEATKGGNYEYNDNIANYISDDYQNDLESSVHGADIIKDDSISSVSATESMEKIYNHSVVVFRGGQESRPKIVYWSAQPLKSSAASESISIVTRFPTSSGP